MMGFVNFLADWGFSPVSFILMGLLILLIAIRMYATRGLSRAPIILVLFALCAATYPWTAGVPIALTNAALLKLPASTLLQMPVVRFGVAAIGDAPISWWWRQSGTCAAPDVGSCNNSIDGNSFIAVFPSSGVDVRQFGADPTGVADSAPAANAMLALGSNHKFVFPPGTYNICSVFTSPYPLVTGAIGIGLFGTSGTPYHDITISAYGAKFATCSAHANIDMFAFAYINNFQWYGGEWIANPANWPANSEPTGILMFNIVGGRFQDIATSGNWGGSTKNPVWMAADNLTDVTFDHISMPQQGECFDFAFLKRVNFTNIGAVGSGDIGNGDQSRTACFHFEYDANTVATYPSLVPFLTTDHVTIGPNVNVSGFTLGYYIAAGGPYALLGNFSNNTGVNATFTGAISSTTLTVSAIATGSLYAGQTIGGSGVTSLTSITNIGTCGGGTPTLPCTATVNNSQSIGSESMVGSQGGGVGGLIIDETASCCVSTTDAPHDIRIAGDYSSNGNTNFPVGGIEINGSAHNSSENIARILIDGSNFYNNLSSGVATSTGPGLLAGSVTLGFNGCGGSSQTACYDTSTLSSQSGTSWTPTDNSGASLTFTSVSASYNIVGNMVFARFSLSYPSTADGSVAKITGLPIASAAVNYGYDPETCIGPGGGIVVLGRVTEGSSNVVFLNASTIAPLTNAQLSLATIQCTFKYPIK